MDSSVHGIWGFSRKEYCRGLPFPPPGDLPNTMIDPASPESPALASEFFTTKPPRKPQKIKNIQPGEEPEPAEVLAEGEQEYWSGLLFPTPGDLPNPRIETSSPVSTAMAGGFFTTSATREAPREAH